MEQVQYKFIFIIMELTLHSIKEQHLEKQIIINFIDLKLDGTSKNKYKTC